MFLFFINLDLPFWVINIAVEVSSVHEAMQSDLSAFDSYKDYYFNSNLKNVKFYWMIIFLVQLSVLAWYSKCSFIDRVIRMSVNKLYYPCLFTYNSLRDIEHLLRDRLVIRHKHIRRWTTSHPGLARRWVAMTTTKVAEEWCTAHTICTFTQTLFSNNLTSDIYIWFFHSFINPFTRSCIHSSRSFIRSFVHPSIHPLYLFVH